MIVPHCFFFKISLNHAYKKILTLLWKTTFDMFPLKWLVSVYFSSPQGIGGRQLRAAEVRRHTNQGPRQPSHHPRAHQEEEWRLGVVCRYPVEPTHASLHRLKPGI